MSEFAMPQDQGPSWGHYAGFGLQIAAGVGLGAITGAWLDRKFHWAPWGVLGGSMLGLAAGLYLLIKEALKMNKD
jgi:F0F1-type ATP synthase assembly protein I